MAERSSHPILAYLGLVLAVSGVAWLIPILAHQDVFSMPWFLAYGLGGCANSLVGVYLIYRGEGWPGVRRVFGGAAQIRFGLGWYGVIFLLVPGINALAMLLADGALGLSTPLGNLLAHPGGAVPLLGMTLLIGPLSEEFGWMGYAFPRFTSRFGQAGGTLLLTLCRIAWHIPMFWIGCGQAPQVA